MNVIALTVFIGLVLVTSFALLFVAQAISHPPGGEQEALLPLASEGNTAPTETPRQADGK